MNQYEERQVASDIDGYYMPSPSDASRRTPELAFNAAKKELITALQRRIDLVERFEFPKFISLKKVEN